METEVTTPLRALLIPADGKLDWQIVTVHRPRLTVLESMLGTNPAATRLFEPAGTIYHRRLALGQRPNKRASFILWAHGAPTEGYHLFGDVLLVGPADRWGEDSDAPQQYVKYLEAFPLGP